MKIRQEDADQIALLERRAEDAIRITKAIEGIKGLRVGRTTAGLDSADYKYTLEMLIRELERV